MMSSAIFAERAGNEAEEIHHFPPSPVARDMPGGRRERRGQAPSHSALLHLENLCRRAKPGCRRPPANWPTSTRGFNWERDVRRDGRNIAR